MGIVDYIVNGMVLVGVYYASTFLFGNELQNLIKKDA